MRLFLPHLLLLILLNGCASVPKLVDKGRTEEAYRLALKRVEHGRPRAKELNELFLAFDALQREEYRRLARLETRPEPSRWPQMHALLEGLHERARDLERYLPLGAPTDYRGGMTVTQLAHRLEEARRRAGGYFRDLAYDELPHARAGDHLAARSAHHHAGRALDYLPEAGGELRPLRRELRELGTVDIALRTGGRDYALDMALTDALDALGGRLPHDEWTRISLAPPHERTDVLAELYLGNWYEDGPDEDVSVTCHSEEVLDYVEEVTYEERINDSTVVTKTKEIEHFKTVTATVTEVEQEYDVRVDARLLLRLPGERRPMLAHDMQARESWDNDYSFGEGDRRALPAFADSGSAQYPPGRRAMLAAAVHEILQEAGELLSGREVVEGLPRGISLGMR